MPNNDYANEPNQSRSEEIIQSILDNTTYDEEARSRIEYLLIELKNAIEGGGGGGGGGGVTSYSPLTEKPKIDNHTLQAGNNTSSDLGLQTKIDADHKLSADVIDDTNSTNKFNVKSDWNAASGATSEILNKPTLGTASAKNVPASGDAATGEVVLGSDSRLTDARNAKDVYNWAKQENKPSYSYSEIQNTPTIPDELSDLADDSTHRTVTDTEKNTWNGKQNALTFDNAPTSNSDNPVKSGGVYTALAAKQNNLSEAQLAAVNSGITSTDVAQITTNKNNILWNTQNGVKNLLNIPTSQTVHGVTFTKDGDEFVTSDTSNDTAGYSAANANETMTLSAGTYTIALYPHASNTQSVSLHIMNSDSSDIVYVNTSTPTATFTLVSAQTIYIQYKVNQQKARFMISKKSLYDADPTYQPYALSNVELTAKEQVNENNILFNSSDIASNWNSGKNKIRVGFTSKTYNTVAITNNGDGTLTINGTNSASSEGVGLADVQSDASTMYDTRFTLPEGTYHLYVQDDNSVVFGVQVYAHNGSNANVKLIQSNTGGDFTYNNSSTYPYIAVRVIIGGAQTYNNFKIYPMICEKSVWDASHKFEQYALSNVELTAETANLIDSTYGTSHNVDLDTLIKGGRYLVNGAESSTSNAPFANWQAVEVYESNLDGYTTLTVQIATELGAGLARKFRRRTYSGGGQYSAWTTWTS